MGATVTRENFFSRTVSHPSGAVTVAALLRIGGHGFNRDANGQPTADKSVDSFLSDNVQFIPTTDMYVGDDKFVRDAAGAGPPVVYRGVRAAGGEPFNVTDQCRARGTEDVFVYSAGVQDVELVFQSA